MNVPDERTCAFITCCLLSSVLLLAQGAEPPAVDIEDLGASEDGMIVVIEGLVASLHAYDSGTESLVIGDSDSGFAANVFCSPGVKDMPSLYLGFGDLVRVEGQVSCDDQLATIYCNSDSVLLVSKSERVVDISVLNRCWELLEGDRFNVTGFLEQLPQGSGYVLRNLYGNFTISAWLGADAYPVLVGIEVVVDCTLFLDRESMAFVIAIWSVRPLP